MELQAQSTFFLQYFCETRGWSYISITLSADNNYHIKPAAAALAVFEKDRRLKIGQVSGGGIFEISNSSIRFFRAQQAEDGQLAYSQQPALAQTSRRIAKASRHGDDFVLVDKQGDYFTANLRDLREPQENVVVKAHFVTHNLATTQFVKHLAPHYFLAADDYYIMKIYDANNLLNILNVMSPFEATLKNVLEVEDFYFFLFRHANDKTVGEQQNQQASSGQIVTTQPEYQIFRMRKEDILNSEFRAQPLLTRQCERAYIAKSQDKIFFLAQIDRNTVELSVYDKDFNRLNLHSQTATVTTTAQASLQLQISVDDKVWLYETSSQQLLVWAVKKENNKNQTIAAESAQLQQTLLPKYFENYSDHKLFIVSVQEK